MMSQKPFRGGATGLRAENDYKGEFESGGWRFGNLQRGKLDQPLAPSI